MAGSWSESPEYGGERRYRTGRAGYPTGGGYSRGSQEHAPDREQGRRPAYGEDSWQERDGYYEDRAPAADNWRHEQRGYAEHRHADGGYGDQRHADRTYGDDGYRDSGYADDGYRGSGYGDDGYRESGYGDGYGGYDDRGYDQAQRREEAERREAARRRMRAQAEARAARAEAEAVAATAAAYAPQRISNKTARRRQIALVAFLGSAVALLGERLATTFGSSGTASAATTPGSTMTGTGTGGDGMTGASPVAGGAMTNTGGKTVLAATTDIPVGSAKIFPDHKLVVTQPTAGTFQAYSTVCTHAGCLLDKVQADKIYCPCHPGVFNLDGTVSSGPPPSSLATKQITVSGNQILL